MPIRLTLRKGDLEILSSVDSLLDVAESTLSAKQRKAWSSFYQRVEQAEMKPRRKTGGPTVTTAIAAFRGVLGKRLVVPAGSPGPEWYAPLQNRIRASGLTEQHLVAAAKVAGAQWKGPIKAESIIRQCDTLLSDANMESIGGMLPEPATAYMEEL